MTTAITVPGLGMGLHEYAVDYVRLLGEHADEDTHVVSGGRDKNGPDPHGFVLLQAINKVLDDDLRTMMERLAEYRPDMETIRASGRTRPSVILDARINVKDNLVFKLSPGPFGFDSHVTETDNAAETDWRNFPRDYGSSFDSRPSDEVAIIRNARGLFEDPFEARRHRAETDANKALRLEATSRLSVLVLAAWEHCKAVLGTRYDVHEYEAPGPVRDGGGRPTHLELVHPREREEHRAAYGVFEDERRRTYAEAALSHARDLLSGIEGDPVDLALSIQAATPEEGLDAAIAKLLTKRGVRTTPTRWRNALEDVEKALDLCHGGWRDEERTVTPVVAPRPAGEGRRPKPVVVARTWMDLLGERSPTPYAGLEFYAVPPPKPPAHPLTAEDILRMTNDRLAREGQQPVARKDFPRDEKTYKALVKVLVRR